MSSNQPCVRKLTPGVYVATLTFFDEKTEELDLTTLHKHILRLAEAKIDGIVTMGSNGEAPHLSREERIIITKEVRSTLDGAGFSSLPIISGASDASVRGTVNLCRDAAAAGADAVLVLPPSYFVGAMSRRSIVQFYHDVAAESPVPLLVYSFPAVSGGIAMDSDLIIEISTHPNVVGTKFTCGDTGKLARVAAAKSPNKPDSINESGYLVFGGLADFGLQALVAGASGFIAGGANILPKTCKQLYDAFKHGKFNEAMKLQAELSEADWYHTNGGIAGTKCVLEKYMGYGGYPRRPLSGLAPEESASLDRKMKGFMVREAQL